MTADLFAISIQQFYCGYSLFATVAAISYLIKLISRGGYCYPRWKRWVYWGDETKFGGLWYPSEVLASLLLSWRWPEQQKQPSRSVLRKRCSENMQQIYRTTPMPKCDLRTPRPKCDFNKVLRDGCSPVNLHIFRTSFRGNTSGWLLLQLSYYANVEAV